jgi:aminoglycoside N3'-acetyltransferase
MHRWCKWSPPAAEGRHTEVVATTPLTVEGLVDDLHRLGVVEGDVVMVHASLRALGPMEDGAAGVVRALDAAVGQEGTVLMMIGARDDWAWVNDRPEAERARLLAEAVAFDPEATPADPEVGVLAEVFRQRAGTVANEHPEGRFAARGKLAHSLIADPPWDDYYGTGSPLERLVDSGGKVLRLGADSDTVTLIHYAEYLAAVPTKRRVVRYRKVIADAHPTIRRIESLDDSKGIVDHAGEDYFALTLRAYLDTGRASTGKVGNARAELLDAGELVRFATSWMSHHLG